MTDTLLLVGTQVCMLFLLIGTGYFLCKKNILTYECRKGMTTVLLNIVTPCVVVAEMQKERTPARIKGLLVTAALYAAYLAVAVFLSWVIVRRKNAVPGETASSRICMIYTNCGFMGLPLLASLKDVLGEDVLFYGSVIIAVNNLFIFTHGVHLFGGKPGVKGTAKLLLTPAVVGVAVGVLLFFTGITLPAVVEKPMEYLASMNTPLAMLLIGAIICRSELRLAINDKRVFLPVIVRNIVFPLLFVGVAALVCRYLPARHYRAEMLTCLIIASCPVAGNCAIFAERYHADRRLAAGIFAISTLFSAVTVPLITTLAEQI